MTSPLDRFAADSDDPSSAATPQPEHLSLEDLVSESPEGSDLDGETTQQPVARRSRKRRFALIASAATVAVLTIAGGTVAAMAKTVTIEVDGVAHQVTTLSGSVEGALSAAELELGEYDGLSHGLDTAIADGSKIQLDRGRPVTVTIDDEDPVEHWTTARTVGAALTDMDLDPADYELSTALGTQVPLDGIEIVAQTLHDVELTGTDGSALTISSTDKTVADLLESQGVTLAAADRLSVPAGTQLKDGLQVSISTLPTVGLTDGANPAVEGFYDGVVTVQDLLTHRIEAGAITALGPEDTLTITQPGQEPVTVAPADIATIAAGTPLVEGLSVGVTRIQSFFEVREEPIAQPADQEVEDNTLDRGKTKVTQEGAAGIAEVTYFTVSTNGQVVGPVEMVRTVKVEAVPTITAVGTKAPPVVAAPAPVAAAAPPAPGGAPAAAAPAPAPAPASSSGVNWEGIADCESSGNWSIVSSNGKYFGGLQFDRGTWLSNGGGEYAPTANLATKEQQIAIAERLYASRGLQPWSCGYRG